MAWAIGICHRCNYCRPDWSGATCYCIFKVRERYWSVLKWRWRRRWTWICDDCTSDTTRQAKRNRDKRAALARCKGEAK